MRDKPAPLAVGDIIHGFANGAFGRDSYECRIIEAVGPDWIVTRDGAGFVEFATGVHSLKLCQANRTPGTDTEGRTCCNLYSPERLTTWGRS